MKKRVLFGFIFIVILFLSFIQAKEVSVCGDGTLLNSCSLTKGYFCEDRKLVERASVCDCPENLVKSGDKCISKYQTESKKVNLRYFFDGEEKEIIFTVYGGMNNYVSELKKNINYAGNESPSRGDFKLKSMDEPEQRNLLIPLVVEIQNLEKKKEDQFRIATSIVQSISYGYSDKTASFFGIELNYSRYPYEVLYENEGICGEKSELLAFLLRELGYEVVLFYNQKENHESVGIRCPLEYSWNNSGYCFIETSGPSIISDTSIGYVGGVRISSEPQIINISRGISLGENLKEYKDAKKLPSEWGKISNRAQYALFALPVAFTWLMALMGYVRSSVRTHWHVYTVMKDNSPDNFIPAIGYAGNMITTVTIMFLLIILFIFWIASLAETRQPQPITPGQ